MNSSVVEKINNGQTYLGIEVGSTRIKASLIDACGNPIADGGFSWENRFENGYWTYPLDEVRRGACECYRSLCENVKALYGVEIKTLGALGISGMMHGYLVFDEEDRLLVPFRTWRNTTCAKASAELTELFDIHIPQRWSVAHFYQAILNEEEHVPHVAYVTTVASYLHYLLTGRREVGMGEASGMFPVRDGDFDPEMVERFNKLLRKKGISRSITDIFPKVRMAGQPGAFLTEDGARFLDPTGNLKAGIPLCPPEGDAGTGMVATNAVLPRTGNVSAGTSIFSMLVLEKPLSRVYEEIDIVTTPDGAPVAMVHCNNCCSELDSYVNLFLEFSRLMGFEADRSLVYRTLYENAMTGDRDCGGVTAYNYLSGEHLVGVEKGIPLCFRTSDSKMSLSNLMRAQLYASMATLKIGMSILFEKERVNASLFLAHGGLFKVKGVAQQILSDALNTPVAVMQTAGEGGAWGMALLASYMINANGASLGKWLEESVFGGMPKQILSPDADGVRGFDAYLDRFQKGLAGVKRLEEQVY